jgi:hypothetical protein
MSACADSWIQMLSTKTAKSMTMKIMFICPHCADALPLFFPSFFGFFFSFGGGFFLPICVRLLHLAHEMGVVTSIIVDENGCKQRRHIHHSPTPVELPTRRAVGLRPTGESHWPSFSSEECRSQGNPTARTVLPAGSGAPAEPREQFCSFRCIEPCCQERLGNPIHWSVYRQNQAASRTTSRVMQAPNPQ